MKKIYLLALITLLQLFMPANCHESEGTGISNSDYWSLAGNAGRSLQGIYQFRKDESFRSQLRSEGLSVIQSPRALTETHREIGKLKTTGLPTISQKRILKNC